MYRGGQSVSNDDGVRQTGFVVVTVIEDVYLIAIKKEAF
jgi:hypothetical protein